VLYAHERIEAVLANVAATLTGRAVVCIDVLFQDEPDGQLARAIEEFDGADPP
jgi:hypothetical protein